MGKKDSTFCRGVVGHPSESKLIFLREEMAYVIDFELEKVLGCFPIASDTGCYRIIFSPQEDTCIVASWRAGILAWDYRKNGRIWSKPIPELDSISRFDVKSLIKGKRRATGKGTILVDAFTGEITKEFKHFDVYQHPSKEVTASLHLTHNKLILHNAEERSSVSVQFDSFAILSIAWSDRTLMYSDPGGGIAGISMQSNKILFQAKRECWFNVPRLTYCETAGEFYAVATDWNAQPACALVKIGEHDGGVHLKATLPNGPFFCFADNSRALVCSDGSVYECENGSHLKTINWSKLIKDVA